MSLAILFHSLCAQRVSDINLPIIRSWSGIRVAGLSLQHGYHSNLTTPKLQHTSNQEQYD